MTEQHEAPEAPAPAVEATEGAPQGAPPAQTQPNPPPVAADAPAQAAVAVESAEAAPASDAAEEGGEGEGDEHESEGADEGGATASDPTKKKRRRRRRKKAGAKEQTPGAPGEVVAAAAGEPAASEPRAAHDKHAREGAGGVFARFFDGAHAGKRHAFSVGEVVAGRVVRINDGAFVVDLFGKATAFVDVFEPHEVPHIPEPASEPAAGAEAAPEAAAPSEAAATEATPGDAAPAEAASVTPEGESPAPASEPAQPVEPTAASAEAVAEPEAAAAAEPETHEVNVEAAEAAVHAEAAGEAHAVDSDHPEHAEHEETEAEPEPAPPPPPALGTIFRGRVGAVAESGHVVLVNRIVDVGAAKQRIVRAREQRQRVRGVVYGFNRGGFDVLVDGVRVFCPASGMALGPIESPEQLLGQRLEFTVPPSKAGTHGLVVSRRGILERQQRKAAKQLFRSLQPGQRLRGRITQVREFGLFVDLGGFEGLVHQSELSFSRGVRPQDVGKPGDEIDVQVLRVGEGQTRKERERVSLSLKALQADPWSEHNELLEPGNIVKGKVVRTTEFGAFIELAPQVEGLLHISELGRELKHANQALEDGQELRVVIERVDRKARRISLSKLSQAEEKSLESGADIKSARPPKPGQHLTVIVDKVDHAGLVVQVPGVFGRRGRGFIPNSEMGTERGTDHRRGFPPGTQIPAKVIGVDRDGGFRFSRKALLVEEEKRAVQDYRREAARQGLGTFGDLLRAKLEGTKQNS